MDLSRIFDCMVATSVFWEPLISWCSPVVIIVVAYLNIYLRQGVTTSISRTAIPYVLNYDPYKICEAFYLAPDWRHMQSVYAYTAKCSWVQWSHINEVELSRLNRSQNITCEQSGLSWRVKLQWTSWFTAASSWRWTSFVINHLYFSSLDIAVLITNPWLFVVNRFFL